MRRKSTSNITSRLKLFRVLGLAILILLILGALAILCLKINDTVQGRGIVVGQQEYVLKSHVKSDIREIFFRSGDSIKKGDILLTLDDRVYQKELQRQRNDIAEMESRIQVSEAVLSMVKHNPLPSEYRHAEINLREYTERERREREITNAYRMLHESSATTLMELQKREVAYINIKSTLERFEEDFKLIKGGYAEKIIKQGEAELALQKTLLSNMEKELTHLEKQSDYYVFRSPVDGTVSEIPTKVGTYVSQGESLITLAAAGPKKFLARINERDIHKVQEGQKVRISSSQYNFFEYGYFYGTVYAIDELPQEYGNSICYTVRILLDGEKYPLRLGSTGEAEIFVRKDYIIKILLMSTINQCAK